MHHIKRRQFLQFTGSALATLGISQLYIQQQSQRYGQVLAKSTSRKLALLIGINEYPRSERFTSLNGCKTDVELQKQLLINRFGFNPKDIEILSDAAASRQGILTAFEEHLIKQAKPGDVVVFHFSGHGSQVHDSDCDYRNKYTGNCVNSTYVTADDTPQKEQGVVSDIMGHTLFLLMYALRTENVTVVLDSCHSGGGTRGNLQIRAAQGGSQFKVSSAEIEYQRELLSKLKLSPSQFIQQRRKGVAKGVVIASAKRNQLAADVPFNGFHAGAFTYALTQHLWQQTENESIKKAFPFISSSTTNYSSTRQEPKFEFKPDSKNDGKPVYFIEQKFVPAEAVITKKEGNKVELYLVAIEPQTLQEFDNGTIFSVVDSRGNIQGQVRLEERNGLVGKGTLISPINPIFFIQGAFLQEKVRGIISKKLLRIGLDSSLGDELIQAKQALDKIDRIEVLPLQEKEVDYILGRITKPLYEQLVEMTNAQLPIGSIGLFSVGLEPKLSSFGPTGEKADAAVKRLHPKLKSLTALRNLKTTLNANSSTLNIELIMTSPGKEDEFIFKARNLNHQSANHKPNQSVNVPIGTPVEFRLTNKEPLLLYAFIFVIDSDEEIAVIFPNSWEVASQDKIGTILPGETLFIPDKNDGFKLTVGEPKGITEVILIVSSTPLKNSVKQLQKIAYSGGTKKGPFSVNDELLQFSDIMLDDLNKKNQGNTSKLAALSIQFSVM